MASGLSAIVLVAVFGLALSQNITCPAGQLSFNNQCFVFGLSNTFKKSQESCQFLGYSLATISNSLTNNYVVSQSTETLFYIGLSRNNTNAPWLWADGTPVSYTNFGNGDIGTNLCVVVFKPDGKWYTVACDSKYAYVCSSPMKGATTTKKAPATTKPATSGTMPTCPDLYSGPVCSDEDFYYGGLCQNTAYLASDTWSDCNDTCVNYLASTVGTIFNSQANFYIQCEISEWGPPCWPDCTGAWIGLKGPNRAAMTKWADGSAVNYTNWASNSPSTCPSGNCCAYLQLVANKFDSQWQLTDCSTNIPLCQCTHPYTGSFLVSRTKMLKQREIVSKRKQLNLATNKRHR